MSIAGQLYQLQDVDLEIESTGQALGRLTSQLGDNHVVLEAKTRLASTQQRLDELQHRQRDAEAETDDLGSKLKAVEEQLYGGRINNPKELTSLQHEAELFKAKRNQLEDGVLAIMNEVEQAETGVALAGTELQQLETDWHQQQQRLAAEIETLKSKLSELGHKRGTLSSAIDSSATAVYDELRKQRGQAVARVEQGICRACRISLPSSDLQQVRSSNLVRCSSCGRILFLP
jgi:predicted  nucleic acid-binding Zn-ribbon protein